MRVLQIHCVYRLGGGEDAVADAEAQLLEDAGHPVLRHRFANPTSRVKAAAALTISVHNPRAIRSVLDAVERFRPDVAHVHNTWYSAGNAILPALSGAGVPVVVTVHNYRYSCIGVDHFRDGICTACVGRSPLAGVRHGCYKDSRALSLLAAANSSYHRARKTLTTSADCIIAPSRFVADRLVEAGIPDEHLTVKAHFVTRRPPRREPASASNRVLFVGRLAPGKGADVLLRAWDRLGPTDMKLVVVGDGELMSPLRESAPRGVEFIGWQEPADVLELMATSRAMVFPSEWYEPFGVVLLEAMSVGLPVLISEIAAVRDIVDPDPRLVTMAGDDTSLADGLRGLTDDALIEHESARVRERQHAEFSPEENLVELEAIYRSVLR